MSSEKYPEWHELSSKHLSGEGILARAQSEGWQQVSVSLDSQIENEGVENKIWWVIAQILAGSLPPAAAFGTLDKIFSSDDWKENPELSMCAAVLLSEALELSSQARLAEIARDYAVQSGYASKEKVKEEIIPTESLPPSSEPADQKKSYLVPIMGFALLLGLGVLFYPNTEKRLEQAIKPKQSPLASILNEPIVSEPKPIEINEKLKNLNKELREDLSNKPLKNESFTYEPKKEEKTNKKPTLPKLEVAGVSENNTVKLKGSGKETEYVDPTKPFYRNDKKEHNAKGWLGTRYEVLVTTGVRPSPNLNAPIKVRLNPGDSVEVVNQFGIWLELRSKNGNSGYVLAQDFKRPKQ